MDGYRLNEIKAEMKCKQFLAFEQLITNYCQLKRLFLCEHKKSLFKDDAQDHAYIYFKEAIKASFLSLCTICFL